MFVAYCVSGSARLRSSVKAVLLSTVLSILPLNDAFAEAKGSVAGAELTGFGRIVFNFDKAVHAKARASNGVMVLEFDQAVNIDIDKLAAQAPGYISISRRDPDGKALRFALVKNVRADLKEAGEKLYLDLLPEDWKGLPPSLPADVVQDLAKRAIDAEETNRKAQHQKELETARPLKVRVGTGPTFSRIIFEMPIVSQVDYKKEGDVVTLVFDGAYQLNAAAVKAMLPDDVKVIEAKAGAASLKVMMTIPNNNLVRGFREDDSFVVDIPTANGKAKPPVKVVLPNPTQEKTAQDKTMQEKAVAQSATGEKPPVDIVAQEAEAAQTKILAAKADAARLTPMQGKLVAPGQVSPVMSNDVQGEVGTGKFSFAKTADGARIKVMFGARPPAAVFSRGDLVWMVFETDKSIEGPELPAELRSLIVSSEVDGVGGAAILRLQTNKAQVVSVAQEDKGWSITLGNSTQAPTEPLVLKRDVSMEGRTVLTSKLSDAGKVIWLDNRDTGEHFAVVTSRGVPQALAKSQHFVEVVALATAHGLVFEPIADDVLVKTGLDDVTVSRDQGLTLSLGVQGANQAGSDGRRTELLLDAKAWKDAGKGVTRERERDLMRSASEAPQRDRTEARLALAKFYLANNMPTNALGVIGTVEKEDKTVGSQKSLKMLKAVSYILERHPADGLKILDEPNMQLEGETALWRAYVDATNKRWTPALVGFRQSIDIIERYPEAIQALFVPLMIEAGLEVRDLNFAAQQLDQLERMNSIYREPALIALYRGRIAEESGRVDDALVQYTLAKSAQSRETEAKARLFHAVLGFNEKRIEPLKAEAELETVGVIWRRDEVELRALAKLGEIYSDTNRWREAFAAARRAEEILPDNALTRKFEDEMGLRFEKLFLDGKSDELDKIQALALFYDFRSYTPPGRKGDEIVRRLADRLAELDLLDQASELLQYQMDKRLGGVAKASVAARAAVMFLQNHKPAEALATLRGSRLASLPDDLRRARALLEARALSDLSRTDLAIEMIAAQMGPDVDRLRADIYWQGKRWREAGEAFELVAGNAWQGTDPLTDKQRTDILRSGIAYVLGSDRLGLDRLRSKFAERMADTNDSQVFKLISAESGVRAREFKELARTVVASDTLSSFLDSYRQRYPETAGTKGSKSLIPNVENAVQPAKPRQAADGATKVNAG
jgi:tetratricopeptide (TPR) repeat protein